MSTSHLTNLAATDPGFILRYRDSQYAAELIAVAVLHLDMFTWLVENDGANTDAFRNHFELAERPTDVLLTLCRANDFITTGQSDDHHLTDIAKEHLVATSPWFLGPYYEPIRDTPITQTFLKVLKSGKPASWQAKDEGTDWHESMMSEEFANSFTQLMNCRGLAMGQSLARHLSPLLEGRKHILDVGAGSGIYSSTILAEHPFLTATVLEQPPVDAIAKKEIEKNGLSDRAKVVSANFFEDPWPKDPDVILLSNVLHDWDFPEVRKILERASEVIPKGGLLIIHEAFLNDTKTGPLAVAEYSALLMNITQGKCYSCDEYTEILEELDFNVGPYEDTIANRGFMTAVKN